MFKISDWFRGDSANRESPQYCYGVFSDGAEVSYAMLNSRMNERINSILDSVEDELSDKEDNRRAVISAYLVQLFSFVARYINRSVKNRPGKSKEWELTQAAVDIIAKEFCDCDISLESIAARLFVSPSNLSRAFKSQNGQLFSEYLREMRLNYSAKLLCETDVTVERIVAECGFRDISSFYRNFREGFGMTPQVYRQINKKENLDTNDKNDEGVLKMEILCEISQNVQNGRSKAVKELVGKAIESGVAPNDILQQGLLAGMSVIGEKFKNNEVFVPEVLVAARAMNNGAQILKPYLAESEVKATGKVCIGTVLGDLHDIGKNLVKMMMEGKGLEVIDLGTDVPPETFVKTAIEENCQIICCSALLTTTMSVMADVVKAAEEAGIRDKVKIMIGGAPISEEYCRPIGADCYSVDAASAAEAAVELCKP